MSKHLSQKPITVANSSGFPLQIGISNVVKESSKWDMLLEEHPWRSDEHGSEGFIDLVVVDRMSTVETLVIECKRVKQAAWVFLLPKVPSSTRSRATVFGSVIEGTEWRHFGWEDRQADPVSYESQYCAIPGQDQGRKNLIERTASELVISVEALANQERELQQKKGNASISRIYIPTIVTTAQLFVSEFDPSSISLEDGCLPEDTPLHEVPYLRYRKSLTTQVDFEKVNSIQDVHADNQRTIFIVNASKFEEFMQEYEFRD